MKTILTISLVLIALTVNAQNFQGKAIYKTSKKSEINFGGENSTMSEKQINAIKARLQKMNQKTYVLSFDKHVSVYKEEVQLKEPKPQVGKTRVFSFGGSGASDVYFKNTQEKIFVNETEIMGKRFLVKDKLPEYEWELSSETKNIGNYTCYKATYSKEVENTKMSSVNGKLTEVKKKETMVITAWYTTQVPLANGPKNYQGLPGLILEINDGKTTIVCTEIILNPTEKISIEEPKKGKIVSLKKYTEIQKQKSKELMEKMKSRKGIDLGNGTTIKMGN